VIFDLLSIGTGGFCSLGLSDTWVVTLALLYFQTTPQAKRCCWLLLGQRGVCLFCGMWSCAISGGPVRVFRNKSR